MSHLNIERLILASRDRDKEEQKKSLRKKCLLMLINHYLNENGLVHSAEILKSESKFAVDSYSLCDNINLESILMDFECYYFLRYQKLPNIVKKIAEVPKNILKNEKHRSLLVKSVPRSISLIREDTSLTNNDNFEKLSIDKDRPKSGNNFSSECSSHLTKAVGLFENHNAEWESFANIIMQDFGSPGKVVHWSDVIGHERAKEILQESIIKSSHYKDLFAAFVSPWKTFLLYGPPGTGKTSLAAAVASENQAAFFNVCISTVISKWRGESEKLIKVLFHLAKHYAPSVIFIDEIDSLMSHRGNDHEASRRMKTEFFTQIDSLISSDKDVFLISATNVPWELDHAVLRRMEKRIFLPLRNEENRILLFEKYLPVSQKIFI